MQPLFFSLADGESGMEEDTRSVSGFLHFDTVSKGLCHLNQPFFAEKQHQSELRIQAVSGGFCSFKMTSDQL